MKARFSYAICTLWFVMSIGPLPADDHVATRAPVSKTVNSKAVVVHLKPGAGVSDGEVLLGDIAMIEGGETKLRSRIAKLDIADSPRPGQTLQVSRDQVVYRLRLAGIDESQCQVHGARSVSLSVQMIDVSEQEIVAAGRDALVERLGKNRDQFNVQLAQPIRGPVRVPGSRDRIQLQARVRPARCLIGKVQVSVAVLSNGKQQLEVPVSFDVQLFQSVAVAKQRIERGQPITKESVSFERQAVDSAADFLTDSTSLSGLRAKRTILPTQVISAADVESSTEDNPVLVKQRDVVKMVVQSRGLRVMASGEAQQDGRAGQMIRVRNVDSQNIVLGRVVDRSVVEIRL